MNLQEPVTPTVLTGWREIARYMGKGVRTVQRWEEDFGLPVRRGKSADGKVVVARARELDGWVATQCGIRAGWAVPGGQGIANDRLLACSRLAAEVEISRMLRASHRTLRAELHSAMAEFRQQLDTLRQESARTSTATSVSEGFQRAPGGTERMDPEESTRMPPPQTMPRDVSNSAARRNRTRRRAAPRWHDMAPTAALHACQNQDSPSPGKAGPARQTQSYIRLSIR